MTDDATLDAFADAGAKLLDLKVAPEWRRGIRANLRVSFAMAALVTGFALPDEAEPAPVFSA